MRSITLLTCSTAITLILLSLFSLPGPISEASESGRVKSHFSLSPYEATRVANGLEKEMTECWENDIDRFESIEDVHRLLTQPASEEETVYEFLSNSVLYSHLLSRARNKTMSEKDVKIMFIKEFGEGVLKAIENSLIYHEIYGLFRTGERNNIFQREDGSPRFYPVNLENLATRRYLSIFEKNQIKNLAQFTLSMDWNGNLELLTLKDGLVERVELFSREVIEEDLKLTHDAIFYFFSQPNIMVKYSLASTAH